jgi:hypothetical protein
MPTDPKQVWQNQPREISKLTLEKFIQRKARDVHAKTRDGLSTHFVLMVLAVACSGFGLIRANDPLQRTAFGCAIAWALAAQYAMHRGMWSPSLPAESGLATSLEFYRREIERRRSLARRFLGWSFGPMVLTIAVFVIPIVREGVKRWLLPNMLPFLGLLVLWIAGIFVLRARARHQLQREIDELAEIEKENL